MILGVQNDLAFFFLDVVRSYPFMPVWVVQRYPGDHVKVPTGAGAAQKLDGLGPDVSPG